MLKKLQHRRRSQATFLAFVSLRGHRPMTASLFRRALCDFAAFRRQPADSGLCARQFRLQRYGELPRWIPGGRLFRNVPGLPCVGRPERTTTACGFAGRATHPADPVQPVHPPSADASAACMASPAGQPKPGCVPSGVGGIVWREVTSCSLAGYMAVTNDNGIGLRCIPWTSSPVGFAGETDS